MKAKPVRLVGREEMRQLDRKAIEEYGIPGLVLMENAGGGAARRLFKLEGRGASALILCGKGNNGGDGFVVARHLHNAGCRVKAVFLGAESDLEKSPDARTNYHIVKNMATKGAEMELVENPPESYFSLHDKAAGCDYIVDAMLGTGTQGAVRGIYIRAIQWTNSCGLRIYALDIPSGLDCDTGRPLGVAVHADRTFTFGAMKKGFVDEYARAYTGEVTVVSIGLPRTLLKEADGVE